MSLRWRHIWRDYVGKWYFWLDSKKNFGFIYFVGSILNSDLIITTTFIYLLVSKCWIHVIKPCKETRTIFDSKQLHASYAYAYVMLSTPVFLMPEPTIDVGSKMWKSKSNIIKKPDNLRDSHDFISFTHVWHLISEWKGSFERTSKRFVYVFIHSYSNLLRMNE